MFKIDKKALFRIILQQISDLQDLICFRVYESPVTTAGIIVSAVILIIFLVVGVLANSLTIAVVMTYSDLQ